jgi:hypothetical protein
MMIDTTVYGLYDGSGGIYHNDPECVPGTLLEASSGEHVYAYLDDDMDAHTLAPMYYLDDDGRGLYCEACTMPVFDPDENYCSDHDDWHEEGEERHNADHGADRVPGECELCRDEEEAEAQADRERGYTLEVPAGQMSLENR